MKLNPDNKNQRLYSLESEGVMAEIIFHISDLHCENCIEKNRQAVGHLNGVEDIQIDLNKKLLKIAGETDPLEISQILQDIRYSPVLFYEDSVQ